MCKPSPAGIAGVLCNEKGQMLRMLSKHVGAKESNGQEVLVILEAIHMYSLCLCNSVLVKSNSSNAISWMNFTNSHH